MFFPASTDAAARLDEAMREDLADSLDSLGVMAAAVLPDDVDMPSALARLRTRRVAPGVFARYYDLVFALQRRAYPEAAALWREIASLAEETPGLQVIPYETRVPGSDCERFDRLISLGAGGGRIFAPPGGDNWRSFESTAREALALLAWIEPPWWAEIQALVAQVIAAVPPADASFRFFGLSSFMIWGAIFTNVSHQRDRVRVLAGLVHEATHLMLFGVSRREPLLTNPPGERYASPLRRDPRPMEGVFHATYVAGRLSRLYEILGSAQDQLTPDEAAYVRVRTDKSRERFWQGHEVVARDAQLTPLGRRVLEEAADHVLVPA